MPVVNLVFFTVVGATIRFDKVLSEPPLMFAAVTVFAARVFALFHATTFAKDVLVGTAGEITVATTRAVTPVRAAQVTTRYPVSFPIKKPPTCCTSP